MTAALKIKPEFISQLDDVQASNADVASQFKK